LKHSQDHTHKLISIQSVSFMPIVFRCLSLALPLYRRNPNRPPVATTENINCSAALMILITALESHVNRLVYFDNKGLSTDDWLLKKLRTYLPQHKNKSLLNQLEEVTACRDSISHALVWEETRVSDMNWKITRQSWDLASITLLRKKIKKVQLKHLTESRQLRLNLVATCVNYIDVAKALLVVLRVLRELEKKYGNPAAVLVIIPYDAVLHRKFLRNQLNDDWEDWVGGALRFLLPQHKTEIERRMHLKRIPHPKALVRGGFQKRGFTYVTPRRGPLIAVPD